MTYKLLHERREPLHLPRHWKPRVPENRELHPEVKYVRQFVRHQAGEPLSKCGHRDLSWSHAIGVRRQHVEILAKVAGGAHRAWSEVGAPHKPVEGGLIHLRCNDNYHLTVYVEVGGGPEIAIQLRADRPIVHRRKLGVLSVGESAG